MRFYLVIILTFALTAGIAGAAFGEGIIDKYSQAMAKSRAGEAASAVEMLLEIAAEHPDSNLADDALFQSGKILQNKLGDYDGAQKAYQAVMEKYPATKNAHRARKLFDYLVKMRKSGDKPLRIYTQVMKELPKLGIEKGMAMMVDLYENYPDFHLRDQVLFWIAENYTREKKWPEAERSYQLLIDKHPDSKFVYFAWEKLGMVNFEMRNFEKAIELFEKLAEFESDRGGASRASELLIAKTHRFIRLRWINRISQGVVALAFLLWIIGIKWKKVTKANIKDGIIDVVIVTSVLAMGLLFAFIDQAGYSQAWHWIGWAVMLLIPFVYYMKMPKEGAGGGALAGAVVAILSFAVLSTFLGMLVASKRPVFIGSFIWDNSAPAPQMPAVWMFLAALIVTAVVLALLKIKGRQDIFSGYLRGTGWTAFAMVVIAVLMGIIFSYKNPTIYRQSVIYFGGVTTLAVMCNHFYVKTNKFGVFTKILLTIFLFFTIGAIVFAVYYFTDVINILLDSIAYGARQGGPPQ